MKKVSLLLLAFVLISVACNKDEEEKEENTTTPATLNPTSTQKGFAIEYTATWCSPCGNWGAPLIHKYSVEAPKGVVISIHSSDTMCNAFLESSFEADRPVDTGIPDFWVGDINTISDDAMKNLLATANADAGVDVLYSKKENSMNVQVAIKFFSPDTGDYYLSVLLLEDGIDGSIGSGAFEQSDPPNPATYKHDFVLRKSVISGEAYGELIASNPVDGKYIRKDYVLSFESSWKNIYPVAIVWKKVVGAKPEYKYINSIKRKN